MRDVGSGTIRPGVVAVVCPLDSLALIETAALAGATHVVLDCADTLGHHHLAAALAAARAGDTTRLVVAPPSLSRSWSQTLLRAQVDAVLVPRVVDDPRTALAACRSLRAGGLEVWAFDDTPWLDAAAGAAPVLPDAVLVSGRPPTVIGSTVRRIQSADHARRAGADRYVTLPMLAAHHVRELDSVLAGEVSGAGPEELR